MSAYIELHVKGGGGIVIEAGSIVGVYYAPQTNALAPGTPDKPVVVVVRGGETFETIGQHAGMILVRAHNARQAAKVRREQNGGDPSAEFFVDWLEPMGVFGGSDDTD